MNNHNHDDDEPLPFPLEYFEGQEAPHASMSPPPYVSPNGKRLALEIIALSRSADWESAKREWVLETVYFAFDPEVCLCGHTPILELCILLNTLNGNRATVGNVCVNKFIGIDSEKIFGSIRRVRSGDARTFNEEAIRYSFSKDWINDWERDFYLSLGLKRKLSQKQEAKKMEINRKLLKRFANARPA